MAKRVMQKDMELIAAHVRDLLSERRTSSWRKKHERQWCEVDRQLEMEPPPQDKDDWHSGLALGMLADASEIITADVLRLLFPTERKWFAPHAEVPPVIGPDGSRTIDQEMQKTIDGILLSLMAQQHSDFGVRDRVKLACTEALAHGSFVATVDVEGMTRYLTEGRMESLRAPVFRVHSMWNCYPDDSPYVIGTELFYQGSMIIVSYMPWSKLQDMEGWVNKEKVPKKDDRDVEITTFYGEVYIDRSRSDPLHLPNQKVVLANDVLVYSDRNPTPFSPILYAGYERQDVRDPYFTSPIIKRAPMHKLANNLSNKYMDGVWLNNEPPIVYDTLDSHMAASGGPTIAPGAKNPTRGTGAFKQVAIGNPVVALTGLTYLQQHIERGTGTDAVRSGVSPGTEQTATEVVKAAQKSEIRTVDFVGTLERQMLRPYLYMQHALNLDHLESYPFFNTEINTPDFMRLSKEDLPKGAHFEIVGSRGLLGEEQRTARMLGAIELMARIGPMAQIQRWDEISRQVWEDAGVKEPERFLMPSQGQGPDDPRIAEMEQALAQMQAELQQAAFLKEQMQIAQAKYQVDLATANAKAVAAGEQLKLERMASQRSDTLSDQEQAIIEEQLQLAVREAKNEISTLKDEFDLQVSILKAEYEAKLRAADEACRMAQAQAQAQTPPAESEPAEEAEDEGEKATQVTAKAVAEMAQAIQAMRENQQRAQEVVFKFWKKKNPEIADVAAEVATKQ
jgi:hypothetical protein